MSPAAGNTLIRPCCAPCQVVNKSLMRCKPSSRSLVRNGGAGVAEQRDLGIVDVPRVGREQSETQEVVLIQIGRRTNAMEFQHELELGAALVQMNRVSQIVLLGKGADGLQQLGR